MSIFHSNYTAAELNAVNTGNLGETLGIQITEIGEDFVRGTMPVDQRTRQPYGLLHGGASVALAESLGSLGGGLTIDREQFSVVGIEINANHLKGKRDGLVTGTARPLHLGRSTQVWEIRIVDEKDALICISRITLAVVPKK